MKRLIALLASIAAVVLGIFILGSYIKTQRTQTAHMSAAIIRVDSKMETDSDGMDIRMYYPVVEYTVDGQRYENQVPDSGTSNSTQYKEGETIEIQYNPEKPDELSIKGSKGSLIGGIFFVAAGAVFLIGCLTGRGFS